MSLVELLTKQKHTMHTSNLISKKSIRFSRYKSDIKLVNKKKLKQIYEKNNITIRKLWLIIPISGLVRVGPIVRARQAIVKNDFLLVDAQYEDTTVCTTVRSFIVICFSFVYVNKVTVRGEKYRTDGNLKRI